MSNGTADSPFGVFVITGPLRVCFGGASVGVVIALLRRSCNSFCYVSIGDSFTGRHWPI